MRGLLQIIAAVGAAAAVGATVVTVYNKHRQTKRLTPSAEPSQTFDPADVMLSAASVVTANSDRTRTRRPGSTLSQKEYQAIRIAAKVYALQAFGYSFIYDPEDYQITDIELAWSAHEKLLGLPTVHQDRTTLIAEIERIGRRDNA